MNGKTESVGPFRSLRAFAEERRTAEFLRTESAGGLLLLIGAVLAILVANTPGRELYRSVLEHTVNISPLHLHLTVGHFVSDGLLTIFFIVAALELKRELMFGDLKEWNVAVVPVVAAFGGMAVPAGIYLTVVAVGGGAAQGWAIPVATDIAFALAVLAVSSKYLPSALRAFLLTLAVIDDIGAVAVIAIFFSESLELIALLSAFAVGAVLLLLQRLGIDRWWATIPLGVLLWFATHHSGVHPTIAGIVVGFALRATPRALEKSTPAERAETALAPASAFLIAPLFAFTAAGVTVSGAAIAEVFTSPETFGVLSGLVLGKMVGIFLGTFLAVNLTKASLDPTLSWWDIASVGALGGIGFTVSMLISELSFESSSLLEAVRTAVIVASMIAALLATILLRVRGRAHKRA